MKFNLIEALREFDALRDDETGKDRVERCVQSSISPAYAEDTVTERMSDELRIALEKRGFKSFYQHQIEAIEKALEGQNVVLQAPTASGKTLAFHIPMLNSLRDAGTHALMLYPTKALAIDQRDQLMKLTDVLPGRKIDSWWYDGDTEKEHRTLIRKSPPSVLITNPDMLHNSFLGYAEQWELFYRGLKWVIVDEIHEYRGYFGSNVAMILRRLSFHLAHLGIQPQFFLCSATCANAKEHASNLTGLEFVEVNANNSMRPRREFVFVQPDIADYHYWDIFRLRTVNASLACLYKGRSALVFCPTRKFAEECHSKTVDEIEKRRESGDKLVSSDVVRVFRAGLAAEERHSVQEGLKRGEVRLVFTTNALEMGIDIGGLDGVIMAGFPDSIMSAWQRIGRAGRDWKEDAFVLYFARNSPLDRFYAANLGICLNKPLDDLVVNPANEDIIDKHLASLLYETSAELDDNYAPVLGSEMQNAVRKKIEEGAVPVRTGNWRPHHGLNIRGGGAGMFILKDGKQEIGSMSVQQQFREAYQQAIYMHGGHRYRVKEVSFKGNDKGEIMLESADPWLRTHATTYTTVTEQDIFAGWRWVDNDIEVQAYYGKVLITDMITTIHEVDERNGEELRQWAPQNNSAKFRNAYAFWICERGPDEVSPAAVNAFSQLLRVGALFSVPLDAHDIFPHAVARERKSYIVESYPGGIGIAKKIFEKWKLVLRTGIEIATNCRCEIGCPNCIVPPRAANDMNKIEAVEFAGTLGNTADNGTCGKFQNGLWEPIN